MNLSLFIAQMLNGVQLGMLLFLLASGLTLVFGIMNFVNLSHGSFYMLGAYFAATTLARTDSFLLAGLAGVAGPMVLALIIERLALRQLYARDHLDQVLATLGLIMFFNEAVRMIWAHRPFSQPNRLGQRLSQFCQHHLPALPSADHRGWPAGGCGHLSVDFSHAHRHVGTRQFHPS